MEVVRRIIADYSVDGVVPKKNFARLVGAFQLEKTEDELAFLFSQLDTDRSGDLDPDELSDWIRQFACREIFEAEAGAAGGVTRHRFTSLARAVGVKVSDAELFEIWKVLDDDGSNFIEYHEIEAWMIKHYRPEYEEAQMTDIEILLHRVPENAAALAQAPAALRVDRAAVLAAVALNGQALQYAARHFKLDREIVLAAVSQNGHALRLAPAFHDDKGVVLASVRQSGDVLELATPALRADKDVVLAAVRQFSGAAAAAAPEVRADREVRLAAAKQHGELFEWFRQGTFANPAPTDENYALLQDAAESGSTEDEHKPAAQLPSHWWELPSTLTSNVYLTAA